MNVVGVEIKGREVRLVALRSNGAEITDVTGGYKPIKLEGDDDAQNVILFRNALFAVFDNYHPDTIVVKWRNPSPPKGFRQENNFGSSPISFKIEGLIQTYEKADIVLIKPQTITAYLKKMN